MKAFDSPAVLVYVAGTLRGPQLRESMLRLVPPSVVIIPAMAPPPMTASYTTGWDTIHHLRLTSSRA